MLLPRDHAFIVNLRDCCLVAAAAIGLSTALLAAPPKCDLLFPAGGQRGQEVQVTGSGSFGNWPVSVWVDRAGLQVEADKDKGKFKIQIADNASGVYLLRFYDAEGASQLRPFSVDSLPEITESEPNNELSEANHLPHSSIVNGRLEKSGDVDGFAVEMKAGQTLVASLDANQTFGSPMDAVLQVCGSAGFVLEQNDDERGVDPQIAFVAPRDGTYVIRTFAFPLTPNSSIAFAGGSTYVYRLTLTTDGFIDHVFPLAARTEAPAEALLFGWNLPDSASVVPTAEDQHSRLFVAHDGFASSVLQSQTTYAVANATSDASDAKPQAIELPTVISGRIDAKGDQDVYQISATKGSKVSIQVESDVLGFRLDPLIQVLDASGKVIGEVDDTNRKRDCVLTQSIPADGEYRIVVHDVHRHGGFRYVYRMTIDEAKPDFSLSLANDAFVIEPGKPLEIPVTIDRRNGFNSEIEIDAVELPAGVQSKIAKSEAKGDSSKSVKVILMSEAGPTAGTFRIVGKTTGESMIERAARFVVSGTTAEMESAWLTVAASKGKE